MYNIIKHPNRILEERMPEFEFNNPIVDPKELEQKLIETMFAYKAIGLAANQVGLKTRVFVMGTVDGPELTRAYFNPSVLDMYEETYDEIEGCLSFPGIYVKIKRPVKISCRWQDSSGEWQEGEFAGYGSKCFLHELDHLDGIVYKEKVSRLKWDLAVKKSKGKNNGRSK